MAVPETLADLDRLLSVLRATSARSPLGPSSPPAEREIANAIARLRAVGAQPPPPPHEQAASFLQRLGDMLELGTETRELLGLPEPEELADRLGVQSPLGRFGVEFLYGAATDPLTYLTLGIGGLARAGTQAAVQTGARALAPRLAVRAGVPFVTRAAELAIPGTEALASAALKLGRAVGRGLESVPLIRQAHRAITASRVPWDATPEARAVFEAFYGKTRAARAITTTEAADELYRAIIRIDEATRDLPDWAQPLVAILHEERLLARALTPRAAQQGAVRGVAAQTAMFDRAWDAAARVRRIAAQTGLPVEQAARMLDDLLPHVLEAQRLRARLAATGLSDPVRRRLWRRYQASQEAFRALVEHYTGFSEQVATGVTALAQAGFPVSPQLRFLRALWQELRTPSAQGGRSLAETLRLGDVRIAATLLGDRTGQVRQALDAIRDLALRDPQTYAAVIRQARAASRELGGVMRELYRLEQLYGFNYEAVRRYVPHLYRDPPQVVHQVLEQLERRRQLAESAVRRAMSPAASFLRRRTFRTLLDAVIHGGLTPIWDPTYLASRRILISAHARSRKAIIDAIKQAAEQHPGVIAVRAADTPLPPFPDWVRSNQLLPLRGYFLHPDVAHAIQQFDDLLPNDEAMSRLFSAVARTASMWKQFVVSRPGTHIRDIIGSFLLMEFAGVPAARGARLVGRMTRLVHQARQAERVLVRDPRNAKALATLGRVIGRAGGREITLGEFWAMMKANGLMGFGHTAETSLRAVDAIIDAVRREATEGPATARRLARELVRGQVRKAFRTGLDISRKFGDYRETVFKAALFWDGLERGMSALDAANRAVRHLFDYADLTHLERRLRAFPYPFWVFTRKVLPNLIEGIFTKPGVYVTLGYAHRAAMDATGLSPEEVPDWARESLAFPVKVGDRHYLVNLGLPTDILAQMSPTILGSKTLRELGLAGVHPLLRVPFELAFNQQAFSGIPVRRGEFDTEPILGGAAQVPADLAYALRQGLATPFVNLAPLLVGAEGPLAQVAGAALGTERPEPIEPEWLPPRPPSEGLGRTLLRLGALSSLATPFEPARQAVISKMLYAQRLQDMLRHLRKDLGVDMPTVDELRPRAAAADPLSTLLRRLRSLQTGAF